MNIFVLLCFFTLIHPTFEKVTKLIGELGPVILLNEDVGLWVFYILIQCHC